MLHVKIQMMVSDTRET